MGSRVADTPVSGCHVNTNLSDGEQGY